MSLQHFYCTHITLYQEDQHAARTIVIADNSVQRNMFVHIVNQTFANNCCGLGAISVFIAVVIAGEGKNNFYTHPIRFHNSLKDALMLECVSSSTSKNTDLKQEKIKNISF
jgi:hypothetical protein